MFILAIIISVLIVIKLYNMEDDITFGYQDETGFHYDEPKKKSNDE